MHLDVENFLLLSACDNVLIKPESGYISEMRQ